MNQLWKYGVVKTKSGELEDNDLNNRNAYDEVVKFLTFVWN